MKDYFGHYIYPYDINGDGIDEVMISHLCLDANGHEIWNDAKYFEDNHDHMDAMEFFDMNGDGKPELLVGQSDAGPWSTTRRMEKSSGRITPTTRSR